MPYDHDHPELAPLPTPMALGPDPEPLDTERFTRIAHSPPPRVAPRPRTCPLSAAFGRHAPCSGGACLFFAVPGTQRLCAVDQWSPEARHDREVAAWYIARRTEAAGGTRPGDPIALPLHTLATPGPGD